MLDPIYRGKGLNDDDYTKLILYKTAEI